MNKTIILGGGLTGLSAGIKTGYPVYEASDRPGGLCRSYEKHGYKFEYGGGHWIFGDGEAIKFISKYEKLKKYRRDAAVYYNQIIPYPVQEHFTTEEPFEHGTMKQWARQKFGIEQCKMFFYPFNKKYTCDLYEHCVQDDAKKSPTRGKGYNDEFYYPVNGMASLADRMAEECKIFYNKRATRIDIKLKKIYFSDGESIKYKKIISTIPLDNLLEMIGIDAPDLFKTSISVVNIGAERGHNCPKNHWLYIPDEKVPFFRVGFYSNVEKSFTFIKDGVSIYVETAFRGYPPSEYHKHKVINTLREWGWIGEVDVFDEHIVDTGYTWMVPGHERKEYLKSLEKNNIISTGRYGKWKFQGIVDTIMDGLSV
jgi:protoporphyrinogen oxidase